MANFTVSPQGLSFNKVQAQGSVSGLYATPQVLSFTLKNTSGASVTITNYGFTSSTAGDAATQQAGILPNSDFTVAVQAGAFPVTVANNASQQFNVIYAPLRRGNGFGDVRSALLVLFAGSQALSNGGTVLNSVGEVVNFTIPQLVVVGVGGGVIEPAFDTARVSPIFWNAGTPNGQNGVVSGSKGMSPFMTMADLDTNPHYKTMLFFAAPVTGSQAQTAFIPAVAATFTTGGASVPYAVATPAKNSSPRGGRSYQVLVFWTDDTVTMDITIRAITTAGNVVVATFLGVNYANANSLFIGNNSGLDLEGLSLTVQTNVTAGATAYNIGAVVTG